jgi:predicted transcriptional regulator
MGKQPNPMIRARVSEEWKLQIEAIATASGRNSSQVIYEAIAQYLGKNDVAAVGINFSRC